MKPIFVIINFLILLCLILLFARKTVVSIFRTRRERINRELDEAESIPQSDIVCETVQENNTEADALKKIAEINSVADTTVSNLQKDTDEECLELRREMISDIERETIRQIKQRAVSLLSSKEYADKLREREAQTAEKILSMVKLTPGDMAYLKQKDVLYVTLTSTFPLPENIVKRIGEHTEKMLAEVNGKTSFWVKEDPSLIGGFRLRIGDTIYDCTVVEELYRLERKLVKEFHSENETPQTLLKYLSEKIALTKPEVHIYQVGRVLTVSDGICWMDGLADIMYGEVVEFECGERGMVLDIQPSRIGCVIYGKYENIESGSRVRRVGRIASVGVGDALLGRVVDALGHAIDGKSRIRTEQRRPIECAAAGIPDRAAVSKPLHTGIKAIDALVPIGQGQRELIIGDRQTGKTSIAIDTIINQKGKDIICIYVAIGQKDTVVADIRSKLEKYGAMEYTVIVSATASKSASLQYIAPFAATAIGEHFMYSGRNVLIVYDDLSKHAVAYRELSLLLHRPSGREAYPGDIFYLHARLLERSAHLSQEAGGGSMTAFPIIETQSGDISSYIPTNVISITDGQIFLDTELFYEGQRPAVNVGLSVSRVGGAAQTKLMKQVSSSLRMTLAQYRELSRFAQFGSDMDEDTQKMLDAGERMMAVLKQGRYTPIPDYRQSLLLFAVSNGFAADYPPENIEAFEKDLFDFAEEKCPDIIQTLKTGKKMSDEFKQKLTLELSKRFSARKE